MKIERTRNASRNIAFGIVLKIYQIIIPFFLRTAMIYCLGLDYVGLNSIFSSVLQVLSLAELGVGSAMVFSMYKPIADDDHAKINALIALYRKYYRIIGLVVMGAGLLLVPFLPDLITGELPDTINLYILYLLNLAPNVLSYWLFAYKNCLLNAYQRTDLSSKVLILTSTIQYALQIIAIYEKNYYAYALIALLVQVLTNILTAAVVTRYYPQYKPVGKLSIKETKVINQKIRDLFTAKIGSVVLNAGDNLVISAFLGVRLVGIYNNYYYIMSSVMSFIVVALTSTTAGLGNSFVVETREKNFETFKTFTFLMLWICGFCISCFLCLYQPFIMEWIGEEGLLSFGIVICLCLYFYIYEMNQMFNIFKDAAGIWHEDRFRPLATAITNLILNLIMVQFWGLYGIVLSTVISIGVVGMPWVLHNIFSTVFRVFSVRKFSKQLLIRTAIIFMISGMCYVITDALPNSLFFIFVRFIIIICLFNALFIIVFRRCREFHSALQLIERALHGKIKVTKLFNYI